ITRAATSSRVSLIEPPLITWTLTQEEFMPLLYRIWRWCLFPKFQILVVASVFGLMTFLTMRPSITQAFGIVSIDPVGIRDFYSAAAQGVAALVGLVLAFLIFDLQSVEASREAAYGNFMGAIERALPLLRDLPDNFHSVHHVVYPLLTHYATTRRMFLPDVEELKGRIPLRTPEYDNFHSAMIDLIEVGNEATENSKVKQEEHTRYLALVCVLTQADEWLSVFVELWRRVNVIHLAIRVLLKLVVI